jgi:hypothetical protein
MHDRPRKSEDVRRPDVPKTQHALPRNRVVEVIERSQEEALRQLRQAGVPETQALLVIRRYAAFAIQLLRELDLIYRQFEALVAHNPERSAAHQEWLDTKAGGLLLTLEAFIADLVAEAINKAKEDYRTKVSQPREVITPAPSPPPPSLWEEARENLGRLLRNAVVLWAAGLSAWFLLWWQVSGSILWGVLAVGVSAVLVRLFRWAGLALTGVLGLLALLLLV